MEQVNVYIHLTYICDSYAYMYTLTLEYRLFWGFLSEVYEQDSWNRLMWNFKLSSEALIAQQVDSKDRELLTRLTSGEDLKSAKIAALKVCI